jgi:hypothetical protein
VVNRPRSAPITRPRSCVVQFASPSCTDAVQQLLAAVTPGGTYGRKILLPRSGTMRDRMRFGELIAHQPKSGDGLIAAELPLMVTVSDGVMVSRLCASKVRDGRKLGRLHIRHALYPLLLTKQTFIDATAISALGQEQASHWRSAPRPNDPRAIAAGLPQRPMDEHRAITVSDTGSIYH